MIRVILVLVLIWAALMPPFFTHGACDAQFDEVSTDLTANRRFLMSPELAAAFFYRSAALPVRVISAEQCRSSRPWFVDDCGRGDLLYVVVPVRNKVCSIYRDSGIRIQLQYDENKHLTRLQSDMKPYKGLRLPWLGINWSWGK